MSTRVPSKRKAMLRNMVSSLFEHERIETTLPKAKAAQVYAERMITLGKRGSLDNRRKAAAFVRTETLVHKIFHELAARYADKTGRDLSQLHFYTGFNWWKSACIVHGVYARYCEGKKSTEGVDMDSLRERIGRYLTLSARALNLE